MKKYKNDYTNGDSGGSMSDGYDKESDSSSIKLEKWFGDYLIKFVKLINLC